MGIISYFKTKHYEKLAAVPEKDFPWIAQAKAELEIAEVPPNEDSPRIAEYAKKTGLVGASLDVAFVNYCLEKTAIEGTGMPLAKSFLSWGVPYAVFRHSSIAVITDGDNNLSVGFAIGKLGDEVNVLTLVNKRKAEVLNVHYTRIVCYRWPEKYF